jgi:hypothetical protein
MDYGNSHKNNGIDDIYFEQRSYMDQLFEIIRTMVHGIIDCYYKSDEDVINDPELISFYNIFKDLFPEFGKISVRVVKKIFTDIVYLASVRHSESHINYYYLFNLTDLPVRKTNTKVILDQINRGEIPIETDVYSSYRDFYNSITSGLYPTVPLNIFGYGMSNRFDNPVAQKYLDDLMPQYNQIKANTPRTPMTEFVFVMQNSNTI